MDYSDPHNFVPCKSTSSNAVWEHFTKSRDGNKAKCLVPTCGAILSCKGGTTGAIRGHLIRLHKIKVDKKIKHASLNHELSESAANDVMSWAKTSDEEFGDNFNLEEFKEEVADFEGGRVGVGEVNLSETVFSTADDTVTNMDSKVEIGLFEVL